VGKEQRRTFSSSQISMRRLRSSLSLRRAYRRMAHRDWIGSMILLLWLHASANLVVLLYSSIVRRRACCAPVVIESASSRMMSLWRPIGSVTFFCANVLMRLRTTSMPLRAGAVEGQCCAAAKGRERRVKEENAPFVGRIELEDALLVVVAEERSRECEDARRLADTGRALRAR